MTGRTVDAEEALRIGLVNRLIDGDRGRSGHRVTRANSPGYSLPVLGFAREAVTRALDTPLHEGLKIEADLSTLAFQHRGRRRRHGGVHREAQAEVQGQLVKGVIVMVM